MNYRDGNVAELAALGNVVIATATEWLFLRHPLAWKKDSHTREGEQFRLGAELKWKRPPQ